ncbi:MAG: DNA-binding transcriptional ArsR family regulator [Planctomycetota bacterium]|jgi:DNA-binding transcriptional ArsR family regulator
MTTRKTKLLDPESISELLKPVRLEIFESLQTSGPLSIAQLSDRLGLPADALYYHIKKMTSIGVIEPQGDETPRREGPGRNGTVFSLVSRTFEFSFDAASRKSRQAWSQGAASVLRLAQRNVATALESPDVRVKGTRRNLLLRRTKARLSPAQLKEVNAHIDAVFELLAQHSNNTKGDLFAVTCAMSPIEEKRKR